MNFEHLRALAATDAAKAAIQEAKSGRQAPDKLWEMVCDLVDGHSMAVEDAALQEIRNKNSKPKVKKEPFDAAKALGIQGSTGLPCIRCKSKNTTYRMVQDRSGDEGMSQYFSCGDCKHNWRVTG